jgi:hypothetical protein
MRTYHTTPTLSEPYLPPLDLQDLQNPKTPSLPTLSQSNLGKLALHQNMAIFRNASVPQGNQKNLRIVPRPNAFSLSNTIFRLLS